MCWAMRSTPADMKRSLALGSDVCAECAVAELLQARPAPAAAAGAAAHANRTTAPAKRTAAPAREPPKAEAAAAGSAIAPPVAASVGSDADPGSTLEGPANGDGTGGGQRPRGGKRGREQGDAHSGAPGGHNAGTAKRDTARWEARVATGRGTRRAALAAEMAALAPCADGETHVARITPMQVRKRATVGCTYPSIAFNSQPYGLALHVRGRVAAIPSFMCACSECAKCRHWSGQLSGVGALFSINGVVTEAQQAELWQMQTCPLHILCRLCSAPVSVFVALHAVA